MKCTNKTQLNAIINRFLTFTIIWSENLKTYIFIPSCSHLLLCYLHKGRTKRNSYQVPIFLKELILCHKLWYSNLFIFATQYRKPEIFQTMNSVKSNNLSNIKDSHHFVCDKIHTILFYLIFFEFRRECKKKI